MIEEREEEEEEFSEDGARGGAGEGYHANRFLSQSLHYTPTPLFLFCRLSFFLSSRIGPETPLSNTPYTTTPLPCLTRYAPPGASEYSIHANRGAILLGTFNFLKCLIAPPVQRP